MASGVCGDLDTILSIGIYYFINNYESGKVKRKREKGYPFFFRSGNKEEMRREKDISSFI